MISKYKIDVKKAKLDTFSRPCVIIGVLTDVWAGSYPVVGLTDVSVNVFVSVKTDVKIVMRTPL